MDSNQHNGGSKKRGFNDHNRAYKQDQDQLFGNMNEDANQAYNNGGNQDYVDIEVDGAVEDNFIEDDDDQQKISSDGDGEDLDENLQEDY